MNGIYQGPGWNEYLPRQWLEFPRDYLTTLPSHPRLLPIDNPQLLLQRVRREPYSDWYKQLIQQYHANKEVALDKHTVMTRRSLFVKQAAFLYRLTGNTAYLHDAIRILGDLPAPSSEVNLEGGTPGVGWGDYLESAEALMDLLVGYDLIFTEIPAYQKNSIEETILKINEQLIGAMNITTRNNHTILFGCAFTLTALVLDHPEQVLNMNANQLYQYGLDVLAESLGNIAPDGGYSEGPGYATYILTYLTRLAVYQQNLFGHSLLDNPALSNLVSWTMDNRKSTGYSNRFDDSNASLYSFFLLAQPLMQNRYHYSLSTLQVEEINIIAGSNLVELFICTEPQTTVSPRYDYIANYYPFYGQLIVKDDWSDPHLTAYFLAEHPKWLADAHEHIDPLNLELSYKTKDILVDAGYGPNTAAKNRPFYKSDRSYNSILIDGRSYNPNPLSNGFPEPEWEFVYVEKEHAGARVTIPYQNGSMNRSFHYLSPDIIVLRDQSILPTKHTITSHFNLKGSVTILDDHQLNIESGDVLTRWISLDNLYSEQSVLTGFYGDDKNNIRFIDFSKSAKKNHQQEFIIIPGFEERRFEITNLEAHQKEASAFLITDLSRQKRIMVGKGKGHLLKYGETATDARFFIIEEDINGRLFFVIEDCQSFRHKHVEIESEVPLSLVLKQTATGWEGVVSSREEGIVKFNGFIHPVLIMNDQIIRKNKEENLVFTVSGENNYISMGLPQSFLNINMDKIRRKTEFAAYQSTIRAQTRVISPNHHLDAQMKSFTMDQLHWAISRAAGTTSFRHTGDSTVVPGVINSLMGLARYNYNPDPTKRNFRIPHFYKVAGEWNNVGVTMSEDGDITADGIWVRNFRFEAEEGERQFALHVNQPLPSTKAIQMQATVNNHTALNYGNTQYKKQQNQYIGTHIRGRKFSISPVIRWNQDEINQMAMTGGWGASRWTVSRWQEKGVKEDYYRVKVRAAQHVYVGSEIKKNTNLSYHRLWMQSGGKEYFLDLNFVKYQSEKKQYKAWDALISKFRANLNWSIRFSALDDSVNLNYRLYRQTGGTEVHWHQSVNYNNGMNAAYQSINISNRINNYYLNYELSGKFNREDQPHWHTGLFPLIYYHGWTLGPGLMMSNEMENPVPYAGFKIARQGKQTLDLTVGRQQTGNIETYFLYGNVYTPKTFPYLYLKGFVKWMRGVGVTQTRINIYPAAFRFKPTFLLYYQRNRQLLVSGGIVWII
ncbi:MAG: hypothetical protein Kow00108_01970 [Calditrichia bacterium]